MTPDFAFTQSVIVKPYLRNSAMSEPIYDDPVKMVCRIEPIQRKLLDLFGNEVVSDGFIMFTAGTRFKVGSIIIWEDQENILLRLSPQYAFAETHVEGWFTRGR